MIKKGLNARLPEIGKIKIGGKGKEKKTANGKTMKLPERYDHFVITTIERINNDHNENFVVNEHLMAKLDPDNKKPKEIPIRLLFDDIDMNFYTSFQSYKGNKLFCHGDGEKAQRDTVGEVECNPETCEIHQKGFCKVSGILTCQIVEDIGAIGGVYRFRTHGWNSVSNILATLRYFADNTNGILAGLPLRLKIVKKLTQDHGTVNTVTIVLDGNELKEQAIIAYRKRKELGIQMKQLEQKSIESGWFEDVKNSDLDEDVASEYYPPELEPADTPEERLSNIIEVDDEDNIKATDSDLFE